MCVKTCLWLELENKQWPSQVCNKKYKRKIYCLRTFGKEGWRGTVSYQMIVNLIFRFAELHIGCFIRYKNTLAGNNFLKCKEKSSEI